MLLYLFFGVATILLSNHISAMEWLVVVPALAYFATKPLLFISSNRWRTGVAAAFFSCPPAFGPCL
ncbi:hypothetical protein A3SI_15201 [Nitritalea halalkaliphila LW7]|uniref:Uncharacterized protein n=1 Tax=Nitritalea halalkaliphila LW7 TaxID=1189621 RepID=I5BYY5_9BACT|nr:hypothetical protein A3SI_15201 [Nitritalea halalkaliphila LW7]